MPENGTRPGTVSKEKPPRDPRNDPRPGDVVRPLHHIRPFHVEEVHADGSISGHFAGGISGSLCGLVYWRKWAKDATVLAAEGASNDV